jgi:hypothetical protein
MNSNDDQAALPDRQAPLRIYRWVKRTGIALLIAFVVLPLTYAGFSCYSGKALQTEIERYHAAGEPIYPKDFQPEPVPDAENAALLLHKAAQTLHDRTPGNDKKSREAFYRPQEITASVQRNADLLQMVRKARSLPKSEWTQPPTAQLDEPNFVPERELLRTLRVYAIHFHQTGDDAETIETVRDILGAARHMDTSPFLIPHLCAVAVAAMASICVEDVLPDLAVADPSGNPQAGRPAQRDQVHALIQELLDEKPTQRALARAIYCDRMTLIDAVRSFLAGTPRAVATPWLPAPTPSASQRTAGFALRPWMERDVLNMSRNLTTCAAAAREPTWPRFNAQTSTLQWKEYTVPLAFAQAVASSPSIIRRTAQLHFRSLADRRMAAVALAIRLYQIDRHHRPPRLQDLVPTYLPRVPDDPFAPDVRPIGYRPNATPPVLYSINLNGVDDNGAFALTPKGDVDYEAMDQPFFLNANRPRQTTTAPATEPGE